MHTCNNGREFRRHKNQKYNHRFNCVYSLLTILLMSWSPIVFICCYCIRSTHIATDSSGLACNKGLLFNKWKHLLCASPDHTREQNRQKYLPSWSLRDFRKTQRWWFKRVLWHTAAWVRSQGLFLTFYPIRSRDPGLRKIHYLAFGQGQAFGMWSQANVCCSEVGQEPCAECQQCCMRTSIWV